MKRLSGYSIGETGQSVQQTPQIDNAAGPPQRLRRASPEFSPSEGMPIARARAQGTSAIGSRVSLPVNDGGKEAVKALLPLLRNPAYGLTTEQVVAIAGNNGGKQAQLPVLRNPPNGLSTEQKLVIAVNDGGKQALGAVKAQLPVLRNPPYALSTEQVAGILSTEQVVAIASNGGGKQALEAVMEQLAATFQRS